MRLAERFFTKGWARFGPDPALAAWAGAARPVAEACLADPKHRTDWLRCGGTWFAGVNVFPNGPDGAVPEAGVPPLAGGALDFVADHLGLSGFGWDRAQVSICFPGYPQRGGDETDAAFRFRKNRDAAHVDGLRRDAARNRSLGETHGFILGIPLNETHADAAPFVVWEGSHEVMRAAFQARFAGIAPRDWRAEDVTETYTATRREVFETCSRVALHAVPGECTLVHRLALHGVAPWTAPAGPPRAIAYFRPDPFPGSPPDWWLSRP